MKKKIRQEIAELIINAEDRCGKAFRSYRPYQPTLDHGAALEYLDEAQRSIAKAREKILNEAPVCGG